MKEFIGVTSGPIFTDGSALKQAILLFHRVAITTICSLLHLLDKSEKSGERDRRSAEEFRQVAETFRSIAGIREIKWLMEQGIAVAPEDLCSEHRLDLSYKEYRKYEEIESRASERFDKVQWEARMLKMDYMMLDIEEETGPLWDKVNKKHDEAWNELQDAHVRQAAARLRKGREFDVVPLVSTTPLSVQNRCASKADVLKIVVGQLPIPDELTPWEHILEYRSDPDSFARFLDLRVWMSEVARSELTPAEVEEKLADLISKYERHMKLHRMKTNTGTLETIITTGAEVLSDLVTIKWGKAAQALFSLKKRQVALLEGELTAPGKEVAYIVKARETFTSK